MDCGELCTDSHRWFINPVVDLVASLCEEVVHRSKDHCLGKLDKTRIAKETPPVIWRGFFCFAVVEYFRHGCIIC